MPRYLERTLGIVTLTAMSMLDCSLPRKSTAIDAMLRRTEAKVDQLFMNEEHRRSTMIRAAKEQILETYKMIGRSAIQFLEESVFAPGDEGFEDRLAKIEASSQRRPPRSSESEYDADSAPSRYYIVRLVVTYKRSPRSPKEMEAVLVLVEKESIIPRKHVLEEKPWPSNQRGHENLTCHNGRNSPPYTL